MIIMSESGENGTAPETAPSTDPPQSDPVPPTVSDPSLTESVQPETEADSPDKSQNAVEPPTQPENPPPSSDPPEKSAKSDSDQPVKPKWKPTPIDVSDLIAEKPKTAPESDKKTATPQKEDARNSIGRSRSRGRRGRSRSPMRRDCSMSELHREKVRASRGHPHCLECNLQFVTGKSEKLHRESQRHQAVLKKDKPFTDKGVTTDFNCFLCWNAFAALEPLREHYQSEEHVQRLKRYGVERLLVEEKPRHFASSAPRDRHDRGSSRKRERSPIFVRWKDYFLLDEYPKLASDPVKPVKETAVKDKSEPPVQADPPKNAENLTEKTEEEKTKEEEDGPSAKVAKTVEDQAAVKKSEPQEVEKEATPAVEATPTETQTAEATATS